MDLKRENVSTCTISTVQRVNIRTTMKLWQESVHTLHFVKPGHKLLCHSFRTVIHWAVTCLRQDVHIHMSISGSQINEKFAQRVVQGRPWILQGLHLSETAMGK